MNTCSVVVLHEQTNNNGEKVKQKSSTGQQEHSEAKQFAEIHDDRDTW